MTSVPHLEITAGNRKPAQHMLNAHFQQSATENSSVPVSFNCTAYRQVDITSEH